MNDPPNTSPEAGQEAQSYQPKPPNLINQAIESLQRPTTDPIYKKLKAMHLTLVSRRFLYYFLTTLELEESCKKAHVNKGHASQILNDFSHRTDFQELMGIVGLDDLTVLGKLSQLLNAKRETFTLTGGIVRLEAPDIQLKAVEITSKVKGWYSDGAKIGFFAPVSAEETRQEVEALE